MKKYLGAAIIFLVVLMFVGIMYYEQYKNNQANDTPSVALNTPALQTYTNTKFGYQVKYPGDWSMREFPDTQTGAGFQPLSSPKDIASECITVDARGTAADEYNTAFSDYVKKAAAVEIQNYEKLNSIQTIVTASGSVGYETTWIYRTMSGQEKVSLPITYFENNKTIEVNNNQLKFKTVQISLNDIHCESTYAEMLSSFAILQ